MKRRELSEDARAILDAIRDDRRMLATACRMAAQYADANSKRVSALRLGALTLRGLSLRLARRGFSLPKRGRAK